MGSTPEDPEKEDRLWKPHKGDDPIGGPPFFASWGRAYLFVIAFLILLILLFYLFTINYR